ncbi:putative DNA-binding protein [Actinacidiphila reveromycinica]|uniref:Putative DNA-binding protein n=1 Tax=Actinacidiphila reveromycinica TaxID=659352 RepID=A0A7U3URK3_9ACTN|nr:helix-turn-helix transcriptional regulator [Streptomyces sp. SN-593]BBA97454.1 putative DNA-binding protein [Streptomyces sp. SN-593]
MAAKLGATGRRLELGLRLRSIRESIIVNGRPMTRTMAAQGTKVSEAALQRIETGAINFRNAGDLRRLLAKYGVDDEEVIESLVELNRDATNQDWVTRYRGNLLPAMKGFVGIEAEAQEIRIYQPAVVHGLLQTEAYAQAIFDLERPVEETTSEFIANNVALRMERKERVIARRPEPVRLWVILAESALRYVVGCPATMRSQYEEITRLSKLDHVTIQVLPMHSRGYRSRSDLVVIELHGGLPPMVQVDNAWGGVSTSDKPKEVARFNRKFNQMISSALPSEETPDFMQRLAREV